MTITSTSIKDLQNMPWQKLYYDIGSRCQSLVLRQWSAQSIRDALVHWFQNGAKIIVTIPDGAQAICELDSDVISKWSMHSKKINESDSHAQWLIMIIIYTVYFYLLLYNCCVWRQCKKLYISYKDLFTANRQTWRIWSEIYQTWKRGNEALSG